MNYKDAKLNNELARPMGILDATRVGGARKKPVLRRGATDCKVTRADGSTYMIAAKKVQGTRSAPIKQRRVIVVPDAPMTYAERVRRFGADNLTY